MKWIIVVGILFSVIAVMVYFRMQQPVTETHVTSNYKEVKFHKDGTLRMYDIVTNNHAEGLYFSSWDDVTYESYFNEGVPCGRHLVYRTSDGLILHEKIYTETFMSNVVDSYIDLRSTLICSRDYDENGRLIGFVTNGVGVSLERSSGAYSGQKITTFGYATNYSYMNIEHCRYWNGLPKYFETDSGYIGSVTVDVGPHPRMMFQWGADGRHVEIRQRTDKYPYTYNMINSKWEHRTEGETCEYIEGVPVILPTMDGGDLVFDLMLAYTNGVTYLSRITDGPVERVKVFGPEEAAYVPPPPPPLPGGMRRPWEK